MTIIGDGKAYVFLKKHGALVHQLRNRSVTLTVDGRVFILTFLLFHDYLTKEIFERIARTNELRPGLAGFETGKVLREVCQRWLTDNAKPILEQPQTLVMPTDLNYSQIALLLNLLVAAQENLERAAAGKRVQ